VVGTESGNGSSRSTAERFLGGLAAVAGAAIIVREAWVELYLVLITAIVALSVWLMLGKKRRPLIRLQKRITLIAAIAIGFWVCTTAALRFADSSGTEDGAGATSVVTVGPRGSQEGPEEIMLGGIVSSIGGAALAIGTLKMRSRIHRVRRRRSKSLNVSRPTEVPSSVEASSWVEASTPAPSLL
jgi:hypothetical protein